MQVQIRRIIEARQKAIAKLMDAGMAADEAARVADERMTAAPESWLRRPMVEFVTAITTGETLTTGGISDAMKARIKKVQERQATTAKARSAALGLDEGLPGWAS